MPKRVVKFKLVPHARMERYRLRTRKEIKRFINARIANAMAERKSSKNVIKTVREKPAYWLKPKSFMVIYKMTRMRTVSAAQFFGQDEECACDERFALKA